MWVFWIVNFEIVVIMSTVKMFCCRMVGESRKNVNEICSPIICPRTEKGRKQRSLCIKSELDVSPPRTSSVCTGDTPRVCVGKGVKLRSNREKASVFSPIAPRFSELSRGLSEKRPFVRPEDGQRRSEVGKKGKYCADCATNCPGASEHTRREGQEKSKARAVAGFALKKKRGSCSIGIRESARLTQLCRFKTGAGGSTRACEGIECGRRRATRGDAEQTDRGTEK